MEISVSLMRQLEQVEPELRQVWSRAPGPK